MLQYPDFGKPFTLETNASSVAVGGVLVQKGPDQKDHPVSYFSRVLTGPERRYAAHDLEGLAVVACVRRFREYLIDRTFTLVTDHANLVWLLRQTKNRRGRWAMELLDYTFKVRHRAGKMNANADALSRVRITSTPTPNVVFFVSASAKRTDVECSSLSCSTTILCMRECYRKFGVMR